MSVPSERRKTPTLQYVTTARDIARRVEPVVDRYPARQWQSLGRYMVEDATLALRNVQLVDATYLYSEDDLRRERALLDEALGYYAHLEVMLDLSIRVFHRMNKGVEERRAEELARAEAEADPDYRPKRPKRRGPSEADVLAIAEMLVDERKLIEGVKRKAPKLLERYLERKRERGRSEASEGGDQQVSRREAGSGGHAR